MDFQALILRSEKKSLIQRELQWQVIQGILKIHLYERTVENNYEEANPTDRHDTTEIGRLSNSGRAV